MFCGQCGKRVLDTMLFCPFCGSPIVIPDQETGEPATAAPAPVEAPEQPAVDLPEAEEEVFPEAEDESEADAFIDLEPEPKEDFEPLHFDEPDAFDALADEPEPEILPAVEEPERPVSLFDDAEDAQEDEAEVIPLEPDEEEDEVPPEEPPRRTSPAGRRPEGPSSRRSNQTFIPVRNVDMDDIFMDNAHPDPEDEYDPYDDDDDDYDGGFDFEEPERGSFVQRHIRGIVGLILLLILIVIFLIWAMMPKGQQLLATANLAWSAETYNDMGYEAYEAGQYHQAATYFERALAREANNYEYAHSAMVAYYEAEETDSALAMLKKCIEMRPDDPEPYHEMLILYPNAEERPWEVKELLRLGYERTGDASLNVGGE